MPELSNPARPSAATSDSAPVPPRAATTDPSPASKLAGLKIDRGAAVPRAHRRRRGWLIALLLALAGAAAWWAMPRNTPVQVVSVRLAYASQQYAELTASGYVVAQRRAAVTSKATGRLIELTVREGSSVRRGELIARLDASDVRAALAAAQAGIVQSAAGLAQAEAGVRQAEVEIANAQAEQRRAAELQAQGFLSPQALDAAGRRLDAARASMASAQAAVASARGAQAGAAAQRQVQQVNLEQTEIRAPFDGVVLVKNANIGDMITPFSSAAGTLGAVVTIADMGTLEVEADVSESNVGKVRQDQPVEITLDALPGVRLRGSVARVVPTVDRAKATVMTKVRFEQIDARILPEMSAKVTFLSQRAGDADLQPVLAVPPGAIVEREGGSLVWRVGRDDRLEAVPLAAGRQLGDVREVRPAAGSTLQAGDRVVLAPAGGLTAGARVEVAGKP